ncbi:MAG: long-chain fatty acid--CoA ligase [Candidatus Neomarinimicrobiota bacterium]|nr:long-chain fatty acid--CoA ligase [Candidatus Neomarinimicrobiota bacterium]
MKPDFSIQNTVPKAFWFHVKQKPESVANWQKLNGVWKPQTWQEYGALAKQIGLALKSSGMEKADKISILSQCRMEWVACDMGIIGMGGITAPIYHSNTPEQVQYIVEHSEAKFIFLENQEQLDKMLKIWNRLPNVKKIIVFDSYVPKDIPNVTTLNKFIQTGVDDDSFEEHIEESDPNDAISFIYTSGTTGNPKAGVISNSNVISSIEHLPEMLDISQNDLTVAYLPLAHIAERLLGHFLKLVYGNQTAFAESIEDMPNNVRQVGPSIFFGTPRVFEKFYAKIATAISDATSFQKKIYHWAISIGKEISISDGSNSFFLKSKGWLAKFLIYNKIMDIFGGRIRYMISGAAPISPDIINFFKWMNITILEGYGMTETTGIISINLPHAVKIGSVGKPYPNTKIKIAEDGEICVMAPQNIKNYFNNKDATDRLLESNNNGNYWLRTGDVGYIDDDGYLFITDRKKDILITAGGKNVAPQYIENLLKTIPYVSQSMVYGDAKPYLTALITLDDDEITKFARDRKILYQDLSDLSQKRVVVQLINNEIQFINEKLPSYETIKKFKILEEDFDQDKDELTPTFKVKRKVVIDNYKILLESMY